MATRARAKKLDGVVVQLQAIEDASGDGTVHFPGGKTLDVTNLGKAYFPKAGYTKGDVMRYYGAVAPVLLPLIADRPLVLRRHPDGIDGAPFFQQNAPRDVPKSVRVASIKGTDGSSRRIVGGDLPTLLYTVQLGAIEVHPWLSRVKSIASADYAVLDLDPTPKATFRRVIQVARWIHEMLSKAGYRAALKTSGSRGLHIFVPMPPRTSYENAREFAVTIATAVSEQHPKDATVQRTIAKRPTGTVYVDPQQNAEGKSVAAAFSVRPRPDATVSMPIAWTELTDSLEIGDFTLANAARQSAERVKGWRAALSGRPAR